jgi:hypothetical protein
MSSTRPASGPPPRCQRREPNATGRRHGRRLVARRGDGPDRGSGLIDREACGFGASGRTGAGRGVGTRSSTPWWSASGPLRGPGWQPLVMGDRADRVLLARARDRPRLHLLGEDRAGRARDRARAPDRRQRRADPGDAAARDAALERQRGCSHALRRRRPGPGGGDPQKLQRRAGVGGARRDRRRRKQQSGERPRTATSLAPSYAASAPSRG